MLSRLLTAAVAAIALFAAALLPISSAEAAPVLDCEKNPTAWICQVEIIDDGSGDAFVPSPPGEFTEGPRECFRYELEVPCQTAFGWWYEPRLCYAKLYPVQPAPEPGQNPAVGAFYNCAAVNHSDCPEILQNTLCQHGNSRFWSDSIPPGIEQYTPAQAANALISTFDLRAIDIGMAPELKVHADDPAGTAPYRRTWVGVPVWLWVDDPQEHNVGPYTRTDTLGGVTVTASASIAGVRWSSSDGQSVFCEGVGTPFDLDAHRDRLATMSPDCGLRFVEAGAQEITATTQWTVTWTANGETGGFITGSMSSAATVQVGELQSVNTAPRR